MNVYANFNLVTYPVTIQESPSDAANYWGACVAENEQNGTAVGQVCAGGGNPSATVYVPGGSTITYICTADWNGGSYSWTSFSGGISSSNPCYNPNTAVNGAVTITSNYQLPTTTTTIAYSYSCGDPGAQNPGGGWQGPYYIGQSTGYNGGSTPVGPATALDPYYGADQGSLGWDGSNFNYNWVSSTRQSEKHLVRLLLLGGPEPERWLLGTDKRKLLPDLNERRRLQRS